MQIMKIKFNVFRDIKYDMLYYVFHHHEHIFKKKHRKKINNDVRISLKIIIIKKFESIDLFKHLYQDN